MTDQPGDARLRPAGRSDGPNSRSARRTFVFGIRSQLPVPEEGWSVAIHDGGCSHSTEDAQTCVGAVRCRFSAWHGEDALVAMAANQVVAATAAIAGLEPVEERQEVVTFPRLEVIAAVTVTLRSDEGSYGFDDALEIVTRASRALLQATGALEAPVTRQQLFPFYSFVDENDDGEVTEPLVVIFEDAYFGPSRADRHQVQRAERHLFAALSCDPVETYHHFKLEARRALQVSGHYEDAVLKAATACEVLIKHTSWYLTWEASRVLPADPCLTNASSGAEIFTSRPAALIGSVLAPRLRGSWDSKEPDAPIARWRNSVARLRNRVIHLGHRPTETEAAEALEVVDVLEKHVMDRLASAVSTYPRSALKLVHRDGLERRGQFNRRARAVWDSESLGDHLRAYLKWLETYDIEGAE